jgi:hypothetical protein
MKNLTIKQRGYYDQYGNKRVCLLYEGDIVKVVRVKDEFTVCEATCRNSERECLIELPLMEID